MALIQCAFGGLFSFMQSRAPDERQAERTAVIPQGRGMKPDANEPSPGRGVPTGRLFRKYVALFLAVVCLALVPSSALDIWFSYDDLKNLLVRIQSEQAKSPADKIGPFVKEIEGQMTWAIQLPLQVKTEDDWRFDAVRLLRQVPAVTEIAQLDGEGKERYRTSREAMDVIGSLADFSRDPVFT